MQNHLVNIAYPILSQQEWQDFLDPMGYGVTHYRLDNHIPDKGFPIITREAVEYLRDFFGQEEVFEVGAGRGYLARALSDLGVNIRAIDSRDGAYTREEWWESPLYFNVEQIDHTSFEEFPGRYVIMSWPCLDTDFALEVAKKIRPHQFLIYQGESRGGCTANAAFFEYLKTHSFHLCGNSEELNDVSERFLGLYDAWYIYFRS